MTATTNEMACVKMQARTEFFLSPTVPTRDEIRTRNYNRRQIQQASEGFYSKIWKPYVCVGHPIELDRPVEILFDNLVDEGKLKEMETTTDIAWQMPSVRVKTVQNNAGNFRSSEKYQQLSKDIKNEIKKSELMNQNVRVGQSFFKMIQKEQDFKKSPISENNHLKIVSGMKAPVEEVYDEDEVESIGPEQLSRPSTAISKKTAKLRPYTPVYNTISRLPSRCSDRPGSGVSCSTRPTTATATSRAIVDIDEDSLYRQLCSLHWLLEAMVTENVENMPRISLSWTIKNDDNKLTSVGSRKEIKTAWEKYVSKLSASKGKDVKGRMLFGAQQTMKSSNVPSVISSAMPNETVSTTAGSVDTQANLLSWLYDKSNAKENQSVANKEWDKQVRLTSRMMKRRKMLSQVRSICEELQKDNNDYEYRKNLHLIRIGKAPISSRNVPQETKLEPRNQYSDKLESRMESLRQKSYKLVEERTEELRDYIRHMSEYKVTVCKNKSNNVPTNVPFHKMLKQFQGQNSYSSHFAILDASRNKNIYADWFLALEEFISEFKDNKRLEQILQRIRHYALITVTKLNVNRLLPVLETLSDWEIKNPDVSASVKFITDHIFMMPENEYQNWFQQTF